MNQPTPQNGHKKNGWWKNTLLAFVIGGALQAAIWIFSEVLLSREETATVGKEMAELQRWRGNTEATLNRMDKEGTNASKWLLGSEREQISQNVRRIEALEAQTRKLDVMEAALVRIEADIKDLKARK